MKTKQNKVRKKDEDPIKFLKDVFSEIENETTKKMNDDSYHWIEHYNTWIDVINAITNAIPMKNLQIQ